MIATVSANRVHCIMYTFQLVVSLRVCFKRLRALADTNSTLPAFKSNLRLVSLHTCFENIHCRRYCENSISTCLHEENKLNKA